MNSKFTCLMVCPLLAVLALAIAAVPANAQAHEYGWAQDANALKEQISATRDDSTLAYLYNELSWSYKNKSLGLMEQYALKGLQHAQQSAYQVARGRALNLLAVAENMRGEYHAAYYKNQEAYQIAQLAQDSFLTAVCLNDLGVYYMMKGLQDSALYNFQTSYGYLRDQTSPPAVFALLNISLIHFLNDNRALFDFYFEKAIQRASQSADPNMLVETWRGAGQAFEEEGKLDSAEYYYAKAMAYSLEKGLPFQTALTQNNLGLFYQQQGLTSRAAAAFSQSISYCLDEKFFDFLTVPALNYLKLLKSQDKPLAMLALLEELQLPERATLPFDKRDLFKLKADALAAIGQSGLAYPLRDSFLLYHDRILDVEKQKAIAEIEANYQARERDAQNQLLKLQQREDQLKLRQQQQSILWLGLLIALIGSLLLLAIRNNRQKQRLAIELEKKVAQKTQELAHSNLELQQSNQELERFNHITSHDLKEPLRNIISFTSLIEKKSGASLTTEAKEYFEHIKRSARQLHLLVEDVLAFSRARKVQEAPTSAVALNQVLDQLAFALSQRPNAKREQLNRPTELPVIATNEQLLFLILKNLAENGLKYNQSPTPTVSVTYRQLPQYHRLYVKDNGIGIPQAYHHRIFELFYRLHDRGTYEGTGLGLAIAAKLAQKLGGKIGLKSDPGKGSTFWLDLPRLPA